MYLDSKDVKVFPSAYRGKNSTNNKQYNPEAKFNAESDFVNIIKRATSEKSFVVSYERNTSSTPVKGELICNISGYWFKLTIDESQLATSGTPWTKVWANIKIVDINTSATSDATNTEYPATSLVPLNGDTAGSWLDSSDEFVGLSLTSNKQTSNVTESFNVLEYDTTNSKFVIPEGKDLRVLSSYISSFINNENKGVSINKDFETETLRVDNNILVGPGCARIKTVTGVSNATIYVGNTFAEADYYVRKGKRAYKFITITSSATTLNFTNATEDVYQKTTISLADGVASFTYYE